MEGRATFRFKDGLCVLHEEALPLMAEARSGRLVNRLVAESFSIFLDVCRRPDAVSPNEWAASVRSLVLSGMGVMDLQPNGDVCR